MGGVLRIYIGRRVGYSVDYKFMTELSAWIPVKTAVLNSEWAPRYIVLLEISAENVFPGGY